MVSKITIGDVRGVLMDSDKRPVLRLLPELDEVSRGYALAHLGDAEDIADQVWLLNATDWIRGGDYLTGYLCEDLVFTGFSRVLHEFALKVAEDFLKSREKQGGEILKKSWDLLGVKRRWLEGEISDRELEKARDAEGYTYWTVGWAADRDAVSAADMTAYRSADMTAAELVSRAAVGTTSTATDWAAYRAAVQKKQLELLGDMLDDSVGIQRGVKEESLESKVKKGDYEKSIEYVYSKTIKERVRYAMISNFVDGQGGDIIVLEEDSYPVLKSSNLSVDTAFDFIANADGFSAIEQELSDLFAPGELYEALHFASKFFFPKDPPEVKS